jgi:hypothetical protein
MRKVTLLTSLIMLAAAAAGAAEAPQAGKAALAPAVKEIGTSIVRIMGSAGVEPLNLFIEPGTVVVWLNQYNGQVRVTFPQKQVTVACKSPVNFDVSEQGAFISKPVDMGAVASLCFVERGTFDYFIERMPISRRGPRDDPAFRFEGKIVVK